MPLNLSNLSQRERIYLAELANKIMNPPVISADTLKCLKINVLQSALNSQSNLHPRKVRAINKILDKIVYPVVLDGEYSEIKTEIESLENQNNENQKSNSK